MQTNPQQEPDNRAKTANHHDAGAHLIKQAREQRKWLYHSALGEWLSPEELVAAINNHEITFHPLDWQLRDPCVQLGALTECYVSANLELRIFESRFNRWQSFLVHGTPCW